MTEIAIERHAHWRVTVETSGEHIVSIEPQMLTGREPSEADYDAIRTAAQHLLSFAASVVDPHDFRCEECNSQTFAIVQGSNGKPTAAIRCVECKRIYNIYAPPALSALHAKAGVSVNWENADDPAVKLFVGFDVEGYVDEYELCGDEGYYSPNEQEKVLLVDAIYGVVSKLHEELRKIIPSSSAFDPVKSGPLTCQCANTITDPCIVCGKGKTLVTAEWLQRMATKEDGLEISAGRSALSTKLQEPVGDGDILSWLETEVSAIDTWYRGSPTYEHDAGWMKEEVFRLLKHAREAFPTTGKSAQYLYALTYLGMQPEDDPEDFSCRLSDRLVTLKSKDTKQ